MKRQQIAETLLAVLLAICLITLAVVLVLNSRWIYQIVMQQSQLQEQTGLSEKEILENYDTLIAYNSVFYRGTLQFPSFPMSEGGAIHFQEVKRIFDGISILCMVSTAVSVTFGVCFHRKRKKLPWKRAGRIAIGVPLILGILIAWNWNWVFITFHKLVFQNDYWLFDPDTDPVITILPDSYFLWCAAAIILLVLVGGILCIRLGKKQEVCNKNADTDRTL